ncbi:MAG: DDE-type integrase/transposase/recombinase [Proteobacteria bacterium]|nr:DDE-type integrase/transposase/recombinase [Pseudomonadota bacterium]
MNRLSREKQVTVLNALIEGCSIRSIERMTQVHRDTIMRLMCRVGQGCAHLMDAKMRGLRCENVQVDELWSFVGKKQKRLTPTEQRAGELGDQYIFVALDADTKLIPAFLVGNRNGENANKFMLDLQSRLVNRIQLSTDAFTPYPEAVENAFGASIDYGQLVKTYRSNGAGRGRYAPPEIVSITKTVVSGRPDKKGISTSYIERQNLTLRMQMRRLTRLTNAFSKKLSNLKAALALHFAWYNLGRIHQSLRVTPAMEAGVTGRVWTMKEIATLAD